MKFGARPLVKRYFDVAASASLLVLASPAILFVALVVRCSLGRPVLFQQQRPGLHGQPFTVLKFRTMRAGAGSDAERLTTVGKLLRATSLDELPQLWNVLRGEMSLVGPRPLLMHYLPLYDERQARRHEVRPGITGLAQVNGRNAVDWETRLETDVVYVETQTFALDLRIIWQTLAQVFQRSGISAQGQATVSQFRGSQPSNFQPVEPQPVEPQPVEPQPVEPRGTGSVEAGGSEFARLGR